MDNCESDWRRPAHQTTEKAVLCFHQQDRSNTLHLLGTSFLSRQRDVIASFLFGVCRVQMDF